MKDERGGMLVVSLRDVNFRFWSHLGCSGQNGIICSPYVVVKPAEKYRNIDWSPLGV